MAWYRTGTVGVTNGATAVALSGGDALANIFPGDTFKGPDGADYEIASITSATGFVLAAAYQGPTASGQPYAIQPTAQSGALRLLLDQVSNLVTNYQGGRDAWSSAASGTLKGRKSAGAGLVEDLSPADVLTLLTSGSAAATLTGSELLATLQGGEAANVTALRLVHEILSLDPAAARTQLALANHEQITVTSGAYVGIGTASPAAGLDLQSGTTAAGHLRVGTGAQAGRVTFRRSGDAGAHGFIGWETAADDTAFELGNASGNGATKIKTGIGGSIRFQEGVTEWGRFIGGNLLVGVSVSAGASHRLAKPGIAENMNILNVEADPNSWSAIITRATGGTPNMTACALYLNRNATNARSINASGTINASGADYAEYMTKAEGCGIIQPGDICGVDPGGLLTDRFDLAHSYAIKSTNPAYTGNDTWASHLVRPEAPVLALPDYTGPERPAVDDPNYEAKLAEWTAAQEAHADAVTAAQGAYTEAMAAYQVALADFEARLETERQKVDRIAFSGQVPVNVQGAQPGQYIDAAPGPDGGIIGVPAETPGPRTVGKVWKILEDGRAWVAVMIG